MSTPRKKSADDAPDTKDHFAAPIGQAMSAAFPTPIVLHDWPSSADLNDALSTLIQQERAAGAGVVKSNVGGWHSPLDFLHRDLPPIHRLLTRIRTVMNALIPEVMTPPRDGGGLQMAIEGWANVLDAGQYNTIHNHPNAAWSGVYYVTGNPDAALPAGTGFGGKLEFVDPRPGASLAYVDNSKLYGRCLVDPQPGRMALFPSWLQHFVHPCQGEGTRISIAFNVMMRG